MNHNILIICESIYQGNTRKLADGMGTELKCNVATCEEAEKMDLKKYELIGLGSGIYFTSHHPKLVKIVGKLREKQKAFIFSTRGRPFLGNYHATLIEALKKQKVELVGEFSCKGYDCTGPYNISHGGNVGRPNEKDVRKARKFVRQIAAKYQLIKDNTVSLQKLKESGKHVGVEENQCIGCGSCSRVCPMNVFHIQDGKSVVNREEDCVHCSKCIDACPQDCITICHSAKELIRIAKKHAKRISL